MNEDHIRMETISTAAGDGPVNGTSMPMQNVFRVRILVFGHGAGDPGFIHMTINRRLNFMLTDGVVARDFDGLPNR